ncbi:hypothetical protein ES703_44227 [subsurface metagenome]
MIDSDGKPIFGKDGKPVYANLEPMMKMMGFASDQKRAGERHDALMGLAKTVRENIGDGVAAIKAAASEVKGTPKSPVSEVVSEQLYQCGNCQAQFRIPQTEFEKVACPSCRTEYTREQLLS